MLLEQDPRRSLWTIVGPLVAVSFGVAITWRGSIAVGSAALAASAAICFAVLGLGEETVVVMLVVSLGLLASARRAVPWQLRLAAPVAALTASAVAATFYTAPSPKFPDRTLWLEGSSAVEHLTMRIQLSGAFHGCSRPVVFAVKGGPQNGPQTSRGGMELLKGSSFKDVVTMARTRSATGGVLGAELTVMPRFHSVGRCFLPLPRLVGLGSRLRTRAETDLALAGAALVRVDGPSPSVSGDPSRWLCDSAAFAGRDAAFTHPSDCRAVLILSASWYQAFQDIMLLIIGALFAVVTTLVLDFFTARRSRDTTALVVRGCVATCLVLLLGGCGKDARPAARLPSLSVLPGHWTVLPQTSGKGPQIFRGVHLRRRFQVSFACLGGGSATVKLKNVGEVAVFCRQGQTGANRFETARDGPITTVTIQAKAQTRWVLLIQAPAP